MKGFELCQKFFEEIGLPAIEQSLSECIPRLAVGLSKGSQSHGNDDEISRDHSWGPGFTVWLVQEDYDQFAEPLQAILDALPQEYLGYRWRDSRPRTSGVIEVGTFIKSSVGCETPPEAAIDWLHIPEEYLFEITPRRIFHDAAGEATSRFEAFTQYPEDVWKKRLSACLAWMWEWGRKHLHRTERRGDLLSASTYWSRFSTYAMKVGFLLNHRYAPYHKWLYHEFLKLPVIAPQSHALIEEGFQKVKGRIEIESQIESIYLEHLKQLGYEPEESKPRGDRIVAYPDNELLRYAGAVQHSIQIPEIRNMKIFWEVLFPPWKATWAYISPSS